MLSSFGKILASTAASIGKTVESTVQEVTGPKALADYDLGEQVGSGGPGMLWKLYRATPKSKAQQTVTAEVCVWFLDKKSLADDRARRGTSKAAEDQLLDIFRADAKVLQKLRHPGIVRVVDPLDESKWAMAMVTEPVFSSLSNALGNLENLSSIPNGLENLELGQLEIKHGLMQLSEALSFIHRNAKIIHRGINPESVFVTTNGGWKFAGFGYSSLADENSYGDEAAFAYPDFDVDSPVLPLQPLLDYTAPELTRPLPISARGGGLDARVSCDLFSMGLLAYHLLTKRPLLRCHNNIDTYHSKVQSLRNLPLSDIPMDLEPELRRMLSMDPTSRPTASEFASSRFFTEDTRLRALQFLDEMIGRGNDQRAEFLNSLQSMWSGFDSRVLRFKVLPPLLNELKNPATQLLALPWVLEVVNAQDPHDFQTRTQQPLLPAMQVASGELLLLFLRHIPALSAKASPDVMMSHLMPMLMRAFEDPDPRLQEETLKRSIALVPKLDFEFVKQAILPRVHMLALRTSVAAVRLQALVCLGDMVPMLDKASVMDILQSLARCASVDHSPPTLMCIVGVADVVTKQYGMEFAAQHILPLVTPLLVVQQLSNAQFARFLKLVMDILTQIQDKRGVSLSEADSVSLDLASMGLGPAEGAGVGGTAPFVLEDKGNKGGWDAADGWGSLSSTSAGSAPAAPLPPMSDPFASMPPLGAPPSTPPPAAFSSPPTASSLSWPAPGAALSPASPPIDPFAFSAPPAGPTGAASGLGVGAGGFGAFGGISQVGSAGIGGTAAKVGSIPTPATPFELVPDKPPPEDDPFADWPPRKPPASTTASQSLAFSVGSAGLGSSSPAFPSHDWASSLSAPPALRPGAQGLGLPLGGGGGSPLQPIAGVGGLPPSAARPMVSPFGAFPPPPGAFAMPAHSSAGVPGLGNAGAGLIPPPPQTQGLNFPPPPGAASAAAAAGFPASPQAWGFPPAPSAPQPRPAGGHQLLDLL